MTRITAEEEHYEKHMENPAYILKHYSNKIDRAIKVKEAFLDLANMLHGLDVVTTFEIGECVLRMEEDLNELLNKVLDDAEYEAGIREELPQSRYTQDWIKSQREAMRGKLKRAPVQGEEGYGLYKFLQEQAEQVTFDELLEALKNAYPYISNNDVRCNIGELIVKAEGL